MLNLQKTEQPKYETKTYINAMIAGNLMSSLGTILLLVSFTIWCFSGVQFLTLFSGNIILLLTLSFGLCFLFGGFILTIIMFIIIKKNIKMLKLSYVATNDKNRN